MKRDIIEINKDLIPYEFEIQIAGKSFLLGINYNETADFFTVDLSKINEETNSYDLICQGEPIIYGRPLWADMSQADDNYPAIDIVPYDESGESDTVCYGNLNETVFLCLDSIEDELDIDVQSAKPISASTEDYSDSYQCEHEQELDKLEQMIDESGVV